MKRRFQRVFVENRVADHPRTQRILAQLPPMETLSIERIDDVFGAVHRPYLHKRTDLQLFIGRKDGALVKRAPPAYGVAGAPHYYFVHAYNCVFECEYCYLQGYFRSPDIVLFVNHEEVCAAMAERLAAHADQDEVWFHAGEFSDSLALAGLSGELDVYLPFFADHPRARLELRSKSGDVRPLLRSAPLPNVIPTFSLTPAPLAAAYEHGTAPTHARLAASRRCVAHGLQVGVHLDPIVDHPQLEELYRQLLQDLRRAVPPASLAYLSVGVVRFTKDVYRSMQNHYPDSSLLGDDFVSGSDGKVRYPRPHRLWVLRRVATLVEEAGYASERVYLCMEDDEPMADPSGAGKLPFGESQPKGATHWQGPP